MSDGKTKLLQRIENDFTYHKPPTEAVGAFTEIRGTAKVLAQTMVRLCPEGRELSTALTRLEEAVMQANAAIARQYPVAPSEGLTTR